MVRVQVCSGVCPWSGNAGEKEKEPNVGNLIQQLQVV